MKIVWSDFLIKLINNDSLIALNDLIGGGEKVDLTVTSPPYDTLRNYNDNLNWNFDTCNP